MQEKKDKRPGDPNDTKSIEGSRRQNFRIVMWLVCAAYLIYLSAKMAKDLMAGLIVGTTKIISIIAVVLFCGVAIFLIVSAARAGIRALREMTSAMAEADRPSDDEKKEGYGYVPLDEPDEDGEEETSFPKDEDDAEDKE